MGNLNSIGLESKGAQELTVLLNDLLANYSVFYQNSRGYHWLIKGDNFFELHVKFEELYTDLVTKVDELAERVLTLGGVPMHAYSEYIDVSEIEQSVNVSDGKKAVSEVLVALTTLIRKQREILSLSGEIDDEGTNALMSDYIREQEKLVWMYTSYLG